MLNEGRAHYTHDIVCCAQDVADRCMITSSLSSITVYLCLQTFLEAINIGTVRECAYKCMLTAV